MNKRIEEILEKVRRGGYEDGFRAKSLLAYPNQSDRYIKPATEAIQTLRQEWESEAYEKGYKDGKKNFVSDGMRNILQQGEDKE